MTEPAPPDRDPVVAERLARLQARRTSDPTPPTPSSAPTDTAWRASGPHRRRAPAATGKIITAGASATAVFGLIAGYGIAERADAGTATADDPPQAAVPTIPLPQPTSPPAPPATVPAPQVIVVVVDAATGEVVSTTEVATADLDLDLGPVTTEPASTVDLAVPAPPAPAPRATPEPAPSPPPQAQSDAS